MKQEKWLLCPARKVRQDKNCVRIDLYGERKN